MGETLAQKYGGVASVKIAAGMQWRDIYEAVSAYNLTIVGGADPNVGIGGWITGAGHSPISSLYGLGADNVLELDVVTANGARLTINEDSFPDLFSAMRGVSQALLHLLTICKTNHVDNVCLGRRLHLCGNPQRHNARISTSPSNNLQLRL